MMVGRHITLLALNFVVLSLAHSWVERVSLVSGGDFTGIPGYARGNVFRTSPEFLDATGPDPMMYLLPPNQSGRVPRISPSDPICRCSQREKGKTTSESPMLEATAEDTIALLYQENGHITGAPQIFKLSPGAVSVYGTLFSEPSDKLLDIHHVWNANQTGGDRRGVLLARMNFDDGSCFQVRNTSLSIFRQQIYHRPLLPIEGANLWCTNIVTLPSSLTSGDVYTLYWVWDWPSIGSNGTLRTPEIYTTCIDIKIAAGELIIDPPRRNLA
ncbi:hypothetical protein BDV97DRAFT_147587 [Delphinella strobiligena]|nr:hypothetical protein BDV97DRAFT_147587 [Delphinella strobiligena]